MNKIIKPTRPRLLMALAVISVGFTALGPTAATWVRTKFHWLFIPMGDGGTYISTSFKASLRESTSLTAGEAAAIRLENEKLKWRNARLRSRCERLEQFEKGDRIFSALYGPNSDPPVRLIPARVVAADSMPYGWSRVVNRGSHSGVSEGMYATRRRLVTDREKAIPGEPSVIAGTALAGRVIESGAFTARVKLVIDNDFQVRVRILRRVDPDKPRLIRVGAREVPLTVERAVTGPMPGLARGNGRDGIVVPEVPKSHMIRPGDTVQTCPEDGAVAAAVTIGKVYEVVVSEKEPRYVVLHVRPAIDPASLRNVYIVVPRQARLHEEGG